MPTTAKQLDLSALPPASRRELQDFYQFLLTRSQKTRKAGAKQVENYRFSDLCGKLSWQGDAVAAQRSLRDEW